MTRETAKAGADWKDGFLFLGNHLALDFLNTRPVQNGEATELLPDLDALLRWFKAAELLSANQLAELRRRWGESPRARRTMETIRELRERLRQDVEAWEAGGGVRRSTVQELNRLMAEHPLKTRLDATPKALSK